MYYSILFFCMLFNIGTIMCSSFMLSNAQYMQLIQFKNSPLIPYHDKEKINLTFYKCFEKYAIKIAIDFKKMHCYKCKNIFTNDIIFASKIGLYKAIQKFNGSSPFTQFCKIYIHSELYKLLCDTYSLSIVPRSYRKKSKYNLTTLEKVRYKKLLKTSLSNNEYQFNNLKNIDENSNDSLNKYNQLEKCRVIWSIIDTLDPFSKRIMYLKYDYLFNKERTNKYIAILMCCSEEYIRKKETIAKIQILQIIQTYKNGKY